MTILRKVILLLIPVKRDSFATKMPVKEIEKNFDLCLNVLRWTRYVGGNSFKLRFEDYRSSSPKFIVHGSIQPPQLMNINEWKVSYWITPSFSRLLLLLFFEGQFFYLGLYTNNQNGKLIFFSLFLVCYMLMNRIYVNEFEGIASGMKEILTKKHCNHLYRNQFVRDEKSSYESYCCSDCGLRISSFQFRELTN